MLYEVITRRNGAGCRAPPAAGFAPARVHRGSRATARRARQGRSDG